MLQIAYYLLACYGASFALTLSPIGLWIYRKPLLWLSGGVDADNRPRGKLGILAHCPACTGFWVGVLASVVVFSPAEVLFSLQGWNVVVGLVIDGLVVCGACWIIHVVLSKLGQFEL